jgi:hypothetical protein
MKELFNKWVENCPTPMAYRWIKREIQSRNAL